LPYILLPGVIQGPADAPLRRLAENLAAAVAFLKKTGTKNT
jgi:hypothetical protein